jgi:uncharacterized protein (TIGR02001 family)
MRKSVLSMAVAAAFATPLIAAAQTPSPLTGNLSIVSDYRFRGISQTYKGPAVQGGVDYAHASGLYIGNWNSSVSSLVYTGGSGIEMDFYAGWKKTFGDFGLDVGTIYYYYPKAEVLGEEFNNHEIYLGGSWKWLSAKLYYSLSDYFGLNDVQADNYWVHKDTGAPLGGRGDSKGTTYFDLTATYPVTDKFSVVGHYGVLNVKNYSDLDYNDWKLGLTYDLRGWVLGAAYVDTDAKSEWYYTAGSKGVKETGKGGLVLSVSKTF